VLDITCSCSWSSSSSFCPAENAIEHDNDDEHKKGAAGFFPIVLVVVVVLVPPGEESQSRTNDDNDEEDDRRIKKTQKTIELSPRPIFASFCKLSHETGCWFFLALKYFGSRLS
jgi:hypothetical protein